MHVLLLAVLFVLLLFVLLLLFIIMIIISSLARGPARRGRFPKFHRVVWGRDPGTLKSDIMSKKTSTINLFGFETLKL